MIEYETIIDKLKDENFMEWLCKLSKDFINCESIFNDFAEELFIDDSYVLNDMWMLESLIFQAKCGWNRKISMVMQIHDFYHEKGIAFNERLFLYKNYKPDKSLSPELQALIDALWKVMELEKGESNG